ncbi:hypothetical protein M430DRAFT_200346 [Amorphotheca resinae ATCC 22711]|uniref:Uncharacterized protein n=1 Tax=Amorphotheca resinae ATCC 22711 TaxID=857342 RepID=A0A2T3BAD0_AMORE|nr:hypothetical protein M430DRAFT_200346 [Amorphotheca resinae ATCC 22711]PSS25281.1 hypothetical protein M430DRAFT_200346 [Amorphotheca resinae ATCC 22711]
MVSTSARCGSRPRILVSGMDLPVFPFLCSQSRDSTVNISFSLPSITKTTRTRTPILSFPQIHSRLSPLLSWKNQGVTCYSTNTPAAGHESKISTRRSRTLGLRRATGNGALRFVSRTGLGSGWRDSPPCRRPRGALLGAGNWTPRDGCVCALRMLASRGWMVNQQTK